MIRGTEEPKRTLAMVIEFNSITGKGVSGIVEDKRVTVGNHKLLDELKPDVQSLTKKAEELRREGQTAMFVVIDNMPVGTLGVAEPIKDSTAEAIRVLHKDNVEVIMLTGDGETTAKAVAAQLGIDQVIAEVLPKQ